MSLKPLVEGDCGGVNPLIQFGAQLTRDFVHKDDGIQAQLECSLRQEDQMINEFLGQVSRPPQSFQMETLLQEMREIEKSNLGVNQQLQSAPRVIDEVAVEWSQEFNVTSPKTVPIVTNLQNEIIYMKPQEEQCTQVREFFDELNVAPSRASHLGEQQPYLAICSPLKSSLALQPDIVLQTTHTKTFFEEAHALDQKNDWVKDCETTNNNNGHITSDFNEKFWQDLQNKWNHLSNNNLQYPWSDIEDYDYFTEYKFCEENPMHDITNALEKGKECLANGDIPSAVLCFEEAVKQEPDNAKAWELLGMTQAENEMDPQAIPALRRSLELHAENPSAIMALSICYTNENLPAHAVKMLRNWLNVHPKYKHLVPSHISEQTDEKDGIPDMCISSIVQNNKLQELQNTYLKLVLLYPHEVDVDIQEALGVLYNLSSNYDKAADCFRAALSVQPQNAKLWNRLGASLANGSRSVEAVNAYQNALSIEPRFIRARYNVGICCLNLKAYKEAAEHLITALNLQANAMTNQELPGRAANNAVNGDRHMSESIWSTLKMILSLMGRKDLQKFVTDRNLSALNEAFPN